MTEELVLSASSIGEWLSCEYRYLLSSVWRVPAPPTMAMAIGTAVHAGAEATHRSDPDPSDRLRRAMTDQLGLMPLPLGEDSGKAMWDAEAMLSMYQTKIMPSFRPTMVERAFIIRVNGQLVSGQIDAADEVSDEVHDTKTTSTLSKFRPAKHVFQLSLYGLAYGQMTGRKAKRLVLDVIARNGKWKQVEVQPDYPEVASVLALARRGIMAGAFEPTGVTSGSCEFCPFLNRGCAYGRVDA